MKRISQAAAVWHSVSTRPAASRLGLLFLFALLIPLTVPAQQTFVPASAIPASALIQPAELHRELQSSLHPLILQVGSRVLFDEAHIPGAEYAGPASRPAGIEALRRRVASLPRRQPIVLYCGCCPWDHCPNIAPAWQLLHRMGFTHLRALYIARNFGDDWVAPGYPVIASTSHAR